MKENCTLRTLKETLEPINNLRQAYFKKFGHDTDRVAWLNIAEDCVQREILRREKSKKGDDLYNQMTIKEYLETITYDEEDEDDF